MNRLAVVEFFNNSVSKSLANCVPIMEILACDTVFYCSTDFISNYPESVARLRAASVEIVVDDFDKAARHTYFLADVGVRGLANDLANASYENLSETDRHRKKILDRETRLITYNHGSGHTLRPGWLQKGDFYLYISEGTMFESVADGVYYCDPNNYPIIGVNCDGVEGAVTGLYHLEGMDELEGLDKKILRQMLAEKMGVEFDQKLPLAVFFHSATLEGKDVTTGLSRLAEYANIIVKYHPSEYAARESGSPFSDFSWPVDVTHKNVFHCTESSFNALLKYTADICMVGLTGGTLASNVLAGIPTFPVHTQRGMAYDPWGQIFDYSVFLRNIRILSVLLAAQHIQSINILDTPALLARICGTGWLNEYHRQIPKIQQEVFGRYRKGKAAAEAAARYIRNALQYGSFADPEFNKRRRSFRGPVARPVTFKGTL